MRLPPRHLAFLLSLGFVTAVPAVARAYPQWQFSTGVARCNVCHFAPAGGRLLTPYGRDSIGSDLSTFEGSGELLHGAVTLPSWLQLGGDFRGAFVDHDINEITGARSAVFPMQADLYGRARIWRSLSFSATGGVRG